MYLRKVHIQNIRSIVDFTWEVEAGHEAGWHVLIGDNGSGKSTILRAIALALVGPMQAHALRQDWRYWLRWEQSQGDIRLELTRDEQLDTVDGAWEADNGKDSLLPADLSIITGTGTQAFVQTPTPSTLWHNIALDAQAGWFSASYGPFRRFSGGDSDSENQMLSVLRLSPHLSIFGENVALTETRKWLKELQFKKLEHKREGTLLDHIKKFVNQDGFLPYNARLKRVSSETVEFVDGNGVPLPIEMLSDGYRSILSMTFELIRQLSRFYQPEQIFSPAAPGEIASPGVVLIDEIDAHLHPGWQRTIGPWLRKHFPNIQFLVTTHSPLVCQAAEVGSIWRLPRPGSDDTGGKVTGTELKRLIYGNVLDAYGTELFGDTSRSDAGKEKLERLAELNLKELDEGLADAEQSEQRQLRAALPTTAHQI